MAKAGGIARVEAVVVEIMIVVVHSYLPPINKGLPNNKICFGSPKSGNTTCRTANAKPILLWAFS